MSINIQMGIERSTEAGFNTENLKVEETLDINR